MSVFQGIECLIDREEWPELNRIRRVMRHNEMRCRVLFATCLYRVIIDIEVKIARRPLGQRIGAGIFEMLRVLLKRKVSKNR